MPKQKILELHVRDSEIQLRAANAALRESEQKYRSMVEIIPDWVWQVDRNGIYTYSSPKVKDLLGYEPEEIIGTSPFDLLPEAEAEHMRAVFHDIAVSRSPIERLENTNVHKDGHLVVLETSAVAIYDEHGEFAGYRGIDRDITKRKEGEAERERLMDSLAEKSSEMERLLRIVTHDLRSPLVNIIGFSNELETDCQKIVEALNSIEMDEQLKENISEIANEYIPDSLNFITSSTKKMDSLITSLSQLSQLGRIELHIEAINMDEMIGEIIKATLYKVKQEGVSITSEHLPNCKGDDKQVNQVFANVIGNAIKYLEPARKGEIKISGQVEGSMSIYCIEDNGVGIPDKHKDKVFEIFHRVDPKSHVAGEGIGLTAAKQMVGRLGGKIRVESELGVGSKFFIALPTV